MCEDMGGMMSEFVGWRCDHCKKIIEQSRDVYRLRTEGEMWREGPPSSDYQNVIKLGFCANCARQTVRSLQAIEGKM